MPRCGMCAQIKHTGLSSDDGTVFICDQCNQFATDLHKIQDDPNAESEMPGGY
jgi:hypothetical protein